jgi:hypothetical protein
MWSVLNSNSGAVIAISTIAYCIFTGVMAFAIWRANVLTARLIKLQAKPQLALRLQKKTKTTIVTFVENCSSNQAHSIELKINGQPMPTFSLWPRENKELPLGAGFNMGDEVKIEISFLASSGERYKEMCNLVVE